MATPQPVPPVPESSESDVSSADDRLADETDKLIGSENEGLDEGEFPQPKRVR
jgi:hypothetical protein